jgi:hypothetical protein
MSSNKRKAADTGGDGPSKKARKAPAATKKDKKKAADNGSEGYSKAPKKAPADRSKGKEKTADKVKGKEKAKVGKMTARSHDQDEA